MTIEPLPPSEADSLRARALRCRTQADKYESEFGPKLRVLADELEKKAERLDTRAAAAKSPPPTRQE